MILPLILLGVYVRPIRQSDATFYDLKIVIATALFPYSNMRVWWSYHRIIKEADDR